MFILLRELEMKDETKRKIAMLWNKNEINSKKAKTLMDVLRLKEEVNFISKNRTYCKSEV